MIKRDEYSNLYKTGGVPYNDSPIKDEKFYLDRMKHYYGRYAYGNCSIGFGGVVFNNGAYRSIKELRDHARSVQSTLKYRDILDPKKQSGPHKGKRMWNISWQPVGILSKFRNIIIDKITSILLEPTTQAVDETARMEKNVIKNQLKLRRMPEVQEITGGVQFDEPDEFAQLESPSDVDEFYAMGGIRLAVEMMMKDAIDISLYRSSWPVIARMIAGDIFDVAGYAVDQIVVNDKQQLKYVDIAKVIIEPSIYPDHRDSSFRGYVEYTKVADIRRYVSDPVKLKKIEGLASKRYSFDTGLNPYPGRGHKEDYMRNNMNFPTYDGFGVPTMKMYFVDVDIERYVNGMHKNGSRVFEKVGPDFSLSDRGIKQGKELIERPILYLHECTWVIGTDIVYNYGVVRGIARDEDMNILFPMTVFMMDEESLAGKCIGFDDDLQMANFKIRRMLSKMAPGPRMILYLDAIKDSIKVGDETLTILDMIKSYQSEGIMVLDRKPEYGLPGEVNNAARPPIDYVPAGIQEDFLVLKQTIMDQIDFIRQVTGVNEVSDGTSSNTDMLRGVMDGLNQATNSALKPYIDLYINGFEAIIRHLGFRYTSLVLMGMVDVGAMPMGGLIKKVVLDERIREHSFNIMVTVHSQETKQMLMQYLMSRVDSLSADAYFTVLNCLISNDLKRAQFLLSKYVSVAQDRQHNQQIEIAQATAQGNAAASQATEEARANTIKVQGDIDLEKLKLEYSLEDKNNESQHKRKLVEIEATNALGEQREVSVVRANNQNKFEQPA